MITFEEEYGYAFDPDDERDVMAMEILRYEEEDEPMYEEDWEMDYEPDESEYRTCTDNFEVSLGFYINRLTDEMYTEGTDAFRQELQNEILEQAGELRKKVLALQAYEEHYVKCRQ